MKNFFIRLIVLALIITACDVFIGFIGKRLVANAKGGDTARKYFIANKVDADVLVFGSSRAIHHYDPDILGDSLGLDVYNCGFDGNGILCTYAYYKMIAKRYSPAILIYDLFSFDYIIDDNHKYLGNLRYFYGDADVDTIFQNVDSSEPVKMLSHLYMYNYNLPQLVMDNIHPLRIDYKGYRPIDKEWKNIHEPDTVQEVYEYDTLKLYYLERLIKECIGKTEIIFTFSPFYGNTTDKIHEPLKELCAKYDVPLINHYTDTAFNNHAEYFADGSHLNRTGATKYSETVAHEIKGILASKADSSARREEN